MCGCLSSELVKVCLKTLNQNHAEDVCKFMLLSSASSGKRFLSPPDFSYVEDWIYDVTGSYNK